MDHFQFLLQFAIPLTLAEVAELIVGLPTEQVSALITESERRGLLQRMDGGGSAGPGESILAHLDPRYRSQEALSAIGHHLATGRCVVLENAFEVAFAERVHDALSSYKDWQIYFENSPRFSYRHHKIPDCAVLPEALHTCAAIFGSSATRSLMSDLSNRDCNGAIAFGASLYLPGDYALPHSDVSGVRNVTLNWYLTRDWSPLWGGELHWCPTWQKLPPAFNTLALFNVSEQGKHYVSHVLRPPKGDDLR
jgi:hypothetical protein